MQITYEFFIKYIGVKFDPSPLKQLNPIMPKMLFYD